MNQKALAMLQGLLSSSGQAAQLLPFLPPTHADALQSMENAPRFRPDALIQPERWAEQIHFSWFSKTLENQPPTVQALFLGVLPRKQLGGVQEQLHLNITPKASSPFLRPFLLQQLHKMVQDDDLLTPEQLPPSPLNALLQLDRKHLIHLADFLGLYDLAADVRQIVDKALLTKIHSALTAEQTHFLSYCTKQPAKWVSAKLELLGWDGSKEQLGRLLHYRGLIRLAKAIYQEDPSFKWHLMHRLDTGRANIIQKELYQKQDPSLTPYFKSQVLGIAKRYQS